MEVLPPRARYLKAPVTPEVIRPISPEEVLERGLPPEVTAVTGPVGEVFLPPQGRCNAVLRLQTEQGPLLLKVARGWYRQQELWAEHQVMNQLQGRAGVPVPASLALLEAGDLSYQVRAYVDGEPMRAVLADAGDRAPILAQMATVLAAIHAVERFDWPWTEWAEASLATAYRNWESGSYDPEDFSPDDPPTAVLRWLQENVPAPGAVSLLHGDYRTKNLLWQNGRVTAVIDWAFADVGDPYYDLGIALSYAAPGAEREAFLAAYGLPDLDVDRLRWCERLSLFLNV